MDSDIDIGGKEANASIYHCPKSSRQSGVELCVPTSLRDPHIEDVLYSCNEYKLAFAYVPRGDRLPYKPRLDHALGGRRAR